MFDDILKYHLDVRYNSSGNFKRVSYHTLIGNLKCFKSTLSKTSINVTILIMCLCANFVVANAKVSDNSVWLPQQQFTDYGSKSYSQNILENGPAFGKVPNAIEVMPGQTVVLSCIVYNLGDRTVSWIRTSDLQILTSGSITFTGDNRFSTEPTDDILSNCWGLMIRNVLYTDSGNYECQLNTEPKLKINVTLIVREQQLMDRPFDGTTIDGPREQEIKPGSTVTLTCRAIISQTNEHENNNLKVSKKDGTHRTKRVVWSVNNIPITLQINRGGINVYTDWSFSEVVSNLTLTSITENDNGVYKCSIDDIGSDEVTLFVIDDSKATDFSKSASCAPYANSPFLIVYIVFYSYLISVPLFFS